MSKALSVMTVALLVAVVGFVAVNSDGSDATNDSNMKITIYDGHTWETYDAYGYTALAGLKSIPVAPVADENYILNLHNDWGDYQDLNPNYGKLTSVKNIAASGNNVWNVYVYQNNAWTLSTQPLGYITPFTDGYYASANICLWYGAPTPFTVSSINASADHSADLVNPVGNSAYLCSFNIRVTAGVSLPSSSTYVKTVAGGPASSINYAALRDGITVYGYGSNAYAALLDAVGTNLEGANYSATYNGWIDTLFGLGTDFDGVNYTYWSQTAGGTYMSFSLGAYSPISDVPGGFTATSYGLVYA